MSLNGNVASDGYNRMNNNAIAQARMETQVKDCFYCHGLIDLRGLGCCERAGSWPSWVVTRDAM